MNQTQIQLSVAIITRNEAENLPRWLEACAGLGDELVAADSGSDDGTVEMLEAAGARVLHREMTDFADQRNFLADNCQGNWIVFLDADEIPDHGLREALAEFRRDPPETPAVYELARKVFFFGRFLRHGGFFPERVARLYRRGTAQWVGQVHESLAAQGPRGCLPGFLEHYSYRTVDEYLGRMRRYSRMAARQMHQQGKTATPLGAWSHAFWAFVSRYLLRLGFLDGYPGYLAARLESLYTLAKYARLLELNRGVE
jgi:glycosyltransferase involved in cell wall biosynthesis